MDRVPRRFGRAGPKVKIVLNIEAFAREEVGRRYGVVNRDFFASQVKNLSRADVGNPVTSVDNPEEALL